MPSVSLLNWNSDRATRLGGIDAQCAAVPATDVVHLDECLRGFVMHLSAHFQGYCRDLYSESSQICTLAVPAGMAMVVQKQFSSYLTLERGNPSNENLVKDFSRFGFPLNFTAASVADHLANGPRVTDLGHLQGWRNRAVHQGTSALGGGVPDVLTLPLLRGWRDSCNGLAVSLDDIMYILRMGQSETLSDVAGGNTTGEGLGRVGSR